jgi:hypothetical protein
MIAAISFAGYPEATHMVTQLSDVLEGSGWQLATPELVVLIVAGTGPGAAIQRELCEKADSMPPETLKSTLARVVVPRETAAHLLRAHAGEGGRFIAGHLEDGAPLNECWTITVAIDWVDACADDHTAGTVFLAGSDFGGTETYTEMEEDR